MNNEQIADQIRANASFQQAEPCYVSIYRRERCYGGPEEGGWWYDVVVLEGGVPFPTRMAAERYLETAKAEVGERNREEAPDRVMAMANLPDEESAYYPEGYIPTGWGDGGELEIVIEHALGSRDNSREGRPRYE
jgi:hypothetical protein